MIEYRPATVEDIDQVAEIHAESWRRNYRGAFRDDFLDGPVFDDRRATWTERLTRPDPADNTVVALDGDRLVGFAHTILDHHPDWGALLDNLHVHRTVARQGIGTGLMARSAAAVLDRASHRSLYLRVLEQNSAAQSFYRARGGEWVTTQTTEAVGGGAITGLVFLWRDPTVLVDGADR